MIGRAALGYPWIFNEIKHYLETGEKLAPPTIVERVETCKQHLQRSLDWKGPILGVVETRRHYTNYFKGIPNFKPYRIAMVTAIDPNEVFDTLNRIFEEVEEPAWV